MTTSELTQDVLKQYLHYDKDTGIFTRLIRTSCSVKIGDVAGCVDCGYIRLTLLGKKYHAHRLAWLYMTGKWPKQEIDHINGVRSDNKICNLREATHSENMKNYAKKSTNTSGYKGVSWSKRDRYWVASFNIGDMHYKSHSHKTAKSASLAYQKFAKEMCGEFYNGDAAYDPEKDLVRVTFIVTKSVHKAIKQRAINEDRTMNKILLEVIEKEFK